MNPEPSITMQEITNIETTLGICFPNSLKNIVPTDIAAQAAAWQGKGDYPGVDN